LGGRGWGAPGDCFATDDTEFSFFLIALFVSDESSLLSLVSVSRFPTPPLPGSPIFSPFLPSFPSFVVAVAVAGRV
jgi:hypothetical protein